MTETPSLRIGTRGSPLALAQAHAVQAALTAAHPGLGCTIEVIRTTGDRVQDRALSEIGGKGLFTKEIEEALLAGAIDLAVHSMKDVPTVLPDGLDIVCILEREDPRDVFLSPHATGLDDLPPGAVVGSASLRRQAQILARRPDLKVTTLRGNVGTRMTKLAEGTVQATLLALAGLNRLGLADKATAILPTSVMLPAVAQGAVGLECRGDDSRTRDLLAPLHHAATAAAVTAERALLAALDGSCRTPIAGLAEITDDSLDLEALVAREDGSLLFRGRRQGPVADAAGLGDELGQELRRAAAAAGGFPFGT